jgi:hypothetical protein
MSALLSAFGPNAKSGGALNSRLVGADRKRLADLPNGAFDPKPKIGEHKVVRYLVGPPGGKIEDTRWWTFAFWAHRQAFSRKSL